MLTIITEDKDIVYIMDPLAKPTFDQGWMDIVNT